ncbi:leucine-rich repeat domain-containing protein [Candidatus Saccharibacteria bacterium]|nr:leucine-rich repeat domain-containing protein [Candidatus Saccharibacteria bacterium]
MLLTNWLRSRKLEEDFDIGSLVISVDSGEDEEFEYVVLEREDVLEACPEGDIERLTSFVVPEGTEVIGIEAFSGAINLRKVVIPEGVYVISIDAFYDCRALENLRLPSSLKCIDNGAFEGCRGMLKLRIPDGVELIGFEAFKDCAFERLVIGNGVEEIEESAFQNCRRMQSVSFGKGIRYVRRRAFEGCRSLKTIRFANRAPLLSLEQDSFKGTKRLKSLKLPRRYRECPPYGELQQAFVDSNIYFYSR